MEPLANAALLLGNYVLIPSLVYGSQLALAAAGVTLVFGVLRFSNFAQGETMAFGTILTILITWYLQRVGVSISPLPTALLAIPFAMVGCTLVTLAFDYGVYRYHHRAKSPPIMLMIVSIGVMLTLNGVNKFIMGPMDVQFADGARFIIRASLIKQATGLNEGITLRTSQLITIVVATASLLGLYYFLFRTRTGKAMRALADNESLALLSGINPERIIRLTWIATACMATLAGALYGLDKSYQAFTYFNLLLPAFAAAIVGGFGNPIGAILGGYVIAFSETLLTYAFKKFVLYLWPQSAAIDSLLQVFPTEYKLAVSFCILVLVLLLRPTGIMGGKTQ